MLIDIGANLTSQRFQKDLPLVIGRAQEAGVQVMIVTGTDRPNSEKAWQLSGSYPSVLYSTAGMHPHHAGDWNDKVAAVLQELTSQETVLAVGECGLDFNRNFSKPADQERALHGQLELAASCGLPVFLHERDAHDRFFAILGKYRDKLAGAVVHCFTGDEAALKAYLDLDCHIGITGWICDERRGLHMHDFVHLIPDNRLMVETDAPYLLPRNIKNKPAGHRNEPMYLPVVVEQLAKIRGQSATEVAAVTTETAKVFFGIR